MSALCDACYAGTREGLILVSEAPPISTERNDGEARRRELADFLRTRRAALNPEDVGLPRGGRRRTPGLRREEVAQIAGVGTTWYTWLEQARDVRASTDVLDALAGALQLSEAEHRHLIRLGRGEQAESLPAMREEASPTVARLIDNLGPNPAYVLGSRWDFLSYNEAMIALFGDPEAQDPGRRNHIWITFNHPSRRVLMRDWEQTARLLLARFRADAARHVGDRAFDELIAEMHETSAEFRKWWPRHEVQGNPDGRKTIYHPVEGKMVFEHAVFLHGGRPGQRLVLYSPVAEEDTSAKLARLLAAHERQVAAAASGAKNGVET
jgi:transcriptional regulator with XRE-family HTH domain